MAFDFIEAMIVLGIAVSILAFPQLYTKKDLTAEENKGIVKTLKKYGWMAVALGILFLFIGIVTALRNN